jgi:hypothetical protein
VLAPNDAEMAYCCGHYLWRLRRFALPGTALVAIFPSRGREPNRPWPASFPGNGRDTTEARSPEISLPQGQPIQFKRFQSNRLASPPPMDLLPIAKRHQLSDIIVARLRRLIGQNPSARSSMRSAIIDRRHQDPVSLDRPKDRSAVGCGAF